MKDIKIELKEKTSNEHASNYQPPEDEHASIYQPPEDGSASVKTHASKDIYSHPYATAFEDFMKARQKKEMKVGLKTISNEHASEYKPPEDIA